MVQAISTLVLSWNWAASWPFDLRWWIRDQTIALNTATPMSTQITKISMCRL